MAVGALSPEKCYRVMFDALRLFRDALPPLLIFGEGSQEGELRARAAAMGLRVRFMGRVPQQRLIGAYGACAALAHTGPVETFGLAVLEAMACGRPVVAAAGGALPEVVGHDGACGALVAPNSAWDTAAALRRVVADPGGSARVGARARERARNLFSVAAMERGYAQLVARHTGFSLSLR
jgi:glycosyltransferase involved in cell wall biosynthesis